MNIVVVGAGKMGLPLACQMADNGGFVTACDSNPETVARINRSELPFEEPGLFEIMARNVAAGRLRATTDTTAAVARAGAVIIIVPAYLGQDNDIDYSILRAASQAVAAGLQPGTLVSYETTLPVGGCRNVLIPVLESSGLKPGRDFHVCFSPERVKSLHVFEHLRKIPKIVGGFDRQSADRAEAFYKEFLGAPVVNVRTLEAAEFIKLAGMVYRDVAIALSNELAAYAEAVGIDMYRTIAAANTDGEAALLLPGIGVGGHCTPVYPYFLTSHAARLNVPQHLAALARATNEAQPGRAVGRVDAALQGLHGKTVHILGVAFRPDVKELAYSPAFPLLRELRHQGAVVTAQDPLYSDDELIKLGFSPAHAGSDTMHAVILNTAHSAFSQPDFCAWHASGVRVVMDGRNFWDAAAVEKAGITYLCVGKPACPELC
ncbi:MAG: nucleotide sugar dehydrogenase [Deltaproteobacteria bacterium]|nr:nucleotide sugar dehydrogenase [Deltaproteobacteria bacterium]